MNPVAFIHFFNVNYVEFSHAWTSTYKTWLKGTERNQQRSYALELTGKYWPSYDKETVLLTPPTTPLFLNQPIDIWKLKTQLTVDD